MGGIYKKLIYRSTMQEKELRSSKPFTDPPKNVGMVQHSFKNLRIHPKRSFKNERTRQLMRQMSTKLLAVNPSERVEVQTGYVQPEGTGGQVKPGILYLSSNNLAQNRAIAKELGINAEEGKPIAVEGKKALAVLEKLGGEIPGLNKPTYEKPLTGSPSDTDKLKYDAANRKTRHGAKLAFRMSKSPIYKHAENGHLKIVIPHETPPEVSKEDGKAGLHAERRIARHHSKNKERGDERAVLFAGTRRPCAVCSDAVPDILPQAVVSKHRGPHWTSSASKVGREPSELPTDITETRSGVLTPDWDTDSDSGDEGIAEIPDWREDGQPRPVGTEEAALQYLMDDEDDAEEEEPNFSPQHRSPSPETMSTHSSSDQIMGGVSRSSPSIQRSSSDGEVMRSRYNFRRRPKQTAIPQIRKRSSSESEDNEMARKIRKTDGEN